MAGWRAGWLGEFGQLLAEAGFTGISVSADYRDDHSPGPDSDIWTFQATRRSLG